MRTLALINGKVYVEREKFAEAVYCEDGIIKFVGSSEEVKAMAGPECKIVDCEGRTVIPGINDSHQHMLQVGQFMLRVGLAGVETVDEIIERCKYFYEQNPEACKDGIFARGWNQDFFKPGEHIPDCNDMDRVSTEIPVVVSRVCGHVMCANHKAMEVMGVTKDTVYPGGEIGHFENGEPDGRFYETAATAFIVNAVPQFDIEKYSMAYDMANEYYLSRGVTSVQCNDAGTTELNMPDIFKLMHQKYDMGEDVPRVRYRHQVAFQTPEAFKDYIENGEYANGKYPNPDFNALGPLKLFKDGSLGGRTGMMRHEYFDDPGNYGVESISHEMTDEFCRIAAENGIQVITHCIGDRAIESMLESYESTLKEPGKNPLRHAINHCQITDKALLERIAKNDFCVYYQPIFLDYDMHAVVSRCGEEMSSTSYAFRTADELGIHIGYGTDAPVEDTNPFPVIYSAVTRKDKKGWPEGGFYPQECVDVYTAVDAYTTGSAYMEFMEDKKGRIKAGQFADMVVLDTDIFTCKPEDIYNILPVMTILDGRIAFEK